MAVYVKKDESFESALRRFKKEVIKSNILNEVRKREYYIAPGEQRRLKIKAATNRAKKKASK